MPLSFIQDENAVEQIDGITYEFPYTMHERDLTDYVVPWHWHEELELNYAYRGSILIETASHSYTIHQGEGYFINTNVMDSKRKAADAAVAVEHAHLFHPILLAGHYRSVYETKYLNPILKNQAIEVIVFRESTPCGKQLLHILRTLTRLQGKSDSDKEFTIRNLLSQAWLLLMQEINRQQNLPPRPAVSSSQERAKRTLRFLHAHYAEPITIAEMASHIGVSSKECIRSFKTTFHQTPTEYLIAYRVEQAKRLLRETDEPITNIAFLTGFHSSAYFSKIFKKSLLCTPKEYRAAHQK